MEEPQKAIGFTADAQLPLGGNLKSEIRHLKSGFLTPVACLWTLDTEISGRLLAHASAALASSIFLVARKRDGSAVSNCQEAVKPELEQIVRERVETLWAMGISGADLVIARVGAGLRAFTRFARVEYANGEEVPAERLLTEVETGVPETILARLSKEAGGKGGQTSLAGTDAATRFHLLWRYTCARRNWTPARPSSSPKAPASNGRPSRLSGALPALLRRDFVHSPEGQLQTRFDIVSASPVESGSGFAGRTMNVNQPMPGWPPGSPRLGNGPGLLFPCSKFRDG